MDENISFFMTKLKELESDAGSDSLSRDDIRRHFDGLSLDERQMDTVISYLHNAGITVDDDQELQADLSDSQLYKYDLEDLSLPEGAQKDEAFSLFAEQIESLEPVSDDEDARLSAAARNGDAAALDTLRRRGMRLVFAVAKAYFSPGAQPGFYDLIQEGSMGLLKASEKYGRHDILFSRYAACWIRQSIIRAIADAGRETSFSDDIAGTLNLIKDAQEIFAKEYGIDPDADELAEYLDIPAGRIREAVELSNDEIKLPQEAEPSRQENCSEDTRDKIAEVIDQLRPLERSVLSFRYGLNQPRGHSMEDVCRRFSLSEDHVRQIEARALMLRRRKMKAGDDTL